MTVTTTWYLLRHVPDLRRREPRNVGILLDGPDGWRYRFLGENDEGEIEPRQLKHFRDINSDVYSTWVAYFKRKARDDRWDDVQRLQSKRRSNYYVELGGQEYSDSESSSRLLDRLFEDLVLPPGTTSQVASLNDHSQADRIGDRLKAGARKIFKATGVSPSENAPVSGKFGTRSVPLQFGFRYDNGQPHLMDVAVHRKKVDQAAADARELSARFVAAREAGAASSFLAFYSSEDFPESRLDEIIVPLEEVAYCIDLSKEKQAEEMFARVTHASEQ